MTKKENSVKMPRIFSQAERDRIEKSLLDAARDCLSLYGVRHTSVDEIVRRAHIAKGTFYLFYDSKEELFLSLAGSFVTGLETWYPEMLQNLDENHIVTSLTAILFRTAERFLDEGIYRLLDSENAALIRRKVSEERYLQMQKDIGESFYMLFSYFSIDDSEEISKFMKAYRAVLILFLREEERKEMLAAAETLIRGLVLQLVQ